MNFGSVYTLHDSDDEEEAVQEDAPSSVHLSSMSPAIGSTLGTRAAGGSVPQLYPPAPARGNLPVIQHQAAQDVDFASDMPDNKDNKEDMHTSGLEIDLSAVGPAFSHAGRAHPLPPAAPREYPPPPGRVSRPRLGLPQEKQQLQLRQRQIQLALQQKKKSRSTHNASGRDGDKGNSQAPPFPKETGGLVTQAALNSTVLPARLPQTLADLAPERGKHGAFGSSSILRARRDSVPAFLPAKSLPPADLAIRQRSRAPRSSRTWTRKVCILCID